MVGLLPHILHKCREIVEDASARKICSQKPDLIEHPASHKNSPGPQKKPELP